MRTYPQNSPEAAARILTLTMLADGHVSQAELDTLDQLHAGEALGLLPQQLHEFVHAVCEDLVTHSSGSWCSAFQLDTSTLDALLSEVDDPALRETIWHLCRSIAQADGHLAKGETDVLRQALKQWNLPFN
jgi:uncharacterized tellurite resistance protein B-like protein